MRDRLDQALIAQDLNGPPCSIAGRRERFAAKAISPVAHPHLVMTDDLDDLFIELLGPAAECAHHLVHGIHGERRR